MLAHVKGEASGAGSFVRLGALVTSLRPRRQAVIAPLGLLCLGRRFGL